MDDRFIETIIERESERVEIQGSHRPSLYSMKDGQESLRIVAPWYEDADETDEVLSMMILGASLDSPDMMVVVNDGMMIRVPDGEVYDGTPPTESPFGEHTLVLRAATDIEFTVTLLPYSVNDDGSLTFREEPYSVNDLGDDISRFMKINMSDTYSAVDGAFEDAMERLEGRGFVVTVH